MSRMLALVIDDRIDNIIAADPADFPEWIDITDADPAPAVGWVRADADAPFAPPPAPPAPAEYRRITRLAFLNRFTQVERVTLEIAGLDNPEASMPARQAAAGIRVMMATVNAANFIDLARPDTQAGLAQLEAGGLLAAGRAAEILNGEIHAIERPPA